MKSTRFYLQDMLEFARQAVDIAALEGSERRGVRELAIERCFEIIGEAATRVEPDVRAALIDIPFRNAIAMRNRIIHGYDTLSLAVLQKTAEDSLPPMIAALEAALDQPLPDEE